MVLLLWLFITLFILIIIYSEVFQLLCSNLLCNGTRKSYILKIDIFTNYAIRYMLLLVL